MLTAVVGVLGSISSTGKCTSIVRAREQGTVATACPLRLRPKGEYGCAEF